MDIIRRFDANGDPAGIQIEVKSGQSLQAFLLEGEDALHQLRREAGQLLGLDRLVEEFGCTVAEAHIILDRYYEDKTCKGCGARGRGCRACTLELESYSERYYYLALLADGIEAPKLESVREWAKRLDEIHATDPLCDYCKLRHKNCRACIDAAESPLERELLKALAYDGSLRHRLQWQTRIRTDGTSYTWPESVDRRTILTIPDFFVPVGEKGLCIYADGLTYHYQDRQQIHRDRTQDGRLMDLGFRLRRFTTDQIEGDPDWVVTEVVNSVRQMEMDA